MVTRTAAPTLRRRAQKFFTSHETPEEFSWIEQLNPLHSRLFAVDLYRTLSEVLIHEGSGDGLRQMLEEWEATAEVDASPKVAEKLLTPRSKKRYSAWKPPDQSQV